MKEKILEIVETTFVKDEKKVGNYGWNASYDGYVVKTNKQEIKLGIYNGQSCCEQWGYFMSEDSFQDYIGATLIDVKVVDECLKVEELKDVYDACCMFVNIETNRGVLQFVAYNSHNGYYGHDAVVISEKLNVSECL